MKTSIFISIIILLAAIWIGRGQAHSIKAAREKHKALTRQEASLRMASQNFSTKLANRASTSSSVRREEAKKLVSEIRELMKKYPSDGSPTSPEQVKEASEFMQRLATLDPEMYPFVIEALSQISELSDGQRNEIVSLCLIGFAQSVPAAALEYLRKSEGLKLDAQVTFMIHRAGLSIWAKRDPAAAFDWVAQNRDSLEAQLVSQMTQEIIGRAATVDPRLSFQLLSSLSAHPEQQLQITLIMSNGLNEPKQFEAFYQAYREQKDSSSNQSKKYLSSAFSSFTYSLIRQPFAKSVELIEALQLPISEKALISEKLASVDPSKVLKNPGAWVNWLVENTTMETRESHLSSYIAHWTRSDYQATASWINDQKPGPLRDLATQRFVTILTPYEPAAAAEWALTLPENPKQKELQQQIYAHWEKIDEEAAREYARQHGLK